jgi:hypothetical protein
MRTKDNKMIRIAGRNVFCSSTIPQNATDKLVLIFLHDALGCSESWKEFPTQLCDKMETAGFCMIDWVMGNQTSGYPMVKGYLEAEADFLRKL